MERPHHVVPDRLLRDSRRNAWIMELPASEFLTGARLRDVTLPSQASRRVADVRGDIPTRSASAGLMERVLPFVMLIWATVVWTFLFYELGHL
jgi:hypothetical protein